MPILEPSLCLSFNSLLRKPHNDGGYVFYIKYLQIASRNIYRNFKTIETSINFKRYLKSKISFINDKFGCALDINSIEDEINDIYDYLYKNLAYQIKNYDKASYTIMGNYYILSDKFGTRFFQPNIFNSSLHSWLLSDTSVAVLIAGDNLKEGGLVFRSLGELYNFEVNLMKAAGFTLVFCLYLNFLFPPHLQYLFESISTNQFIEIHLFYDNEDFDSLIKELYESDCFDRFEGHLYIYHHSHTFRKQSEYHNFFKKLKQIPQITFFSFAQKITKSISTYELNKTSPFQYCQTGFKCKKMRIYLSNIPIYDNESDFESFVPLQVSGISMCYVSPDDFLIWKNKRVEILLYDESKNSVIKKFVNFDDLHKIKIDFYVNEMLSISKISEKTIKKIDEIEENIRKISKQKKGRSYSRDLIFSFSNEQLIQKSIEQAAYAYKRASETHFSIHRTQIYTILEACRILLNKENDSIVNKLIHEKKEIEKTLSVSLLDYIDTTKAFDNKSTLMNCELSTLTNKIITYISNLTPNVKERFSRSLFDKPARYLDHILKTSPNILINEIFSNSFNNAYQSLLSQKEEIEEKINEIQMKNPKGVVYQVETGEGKSCIVSIIAAILALNGKTVHITSSNIKLANRDYMLSFDFFRLLKLRPAVLAHDNELPIKVVKKKNDNEKQKEKGEVKNEAKNDEIQTNFEFDDEIKKLFKSNMDSYYNTNTQDNNTEYSKYYNDKDLDYYHSDMFNNSSRMNFAVCGLDNNNKEVDNKPNIIFSTFVNFECFYLKLMEMCPGLIDSYYSKCALLIDEADSILIDEIANGTIVSCEMKSNSKEILKFIYDQKMKDRPAEETFEEIKDKWPICQDLTLHDIKRLYSEVDLVVHGDDFTNGKKYYIMDLEVKNDKKKNKIMHQVLDVTKNIAVKVGKGLFKEIFSNKKDGEEEDDDDEDDDDEDDDDEEEEDEDKEDSPTTVFKQIIPFDYSHKGILEPNKEFGGCIQQFIAINEYEKDKIQNKNMIIKELSMSYLFVSHPIFVKLYSKVCGFTGTIGQKKDKQIYRETYFLETLRIPRNEVNQRVEFPMIICETIIERNEYIVYEVVQFHKQENPVLVIFQDMKEIDDVLYRLNLYGIHHINVFDGKDSVVRPDIIAGLKSSVSLGTNFCGRGTNIKTYDKPLHVIISYYTSNFRVMNQAHGRTARQGKKGTSRIICLKSEFMNPVSFDERGINSVIEEFTIKNQMQTQFIEDLMETRPWIFSHEMTKQTLSTQDIINMRNARINVNRVVAYNLEFPFKMSIDTFLKIQAQKIFSILNCPNSKYTWRLFQRYVREMVFESWSLMINKVDEKFFEKKENEEYKRELDDLKNLNLDVFSYEYQKRRKEINEKFYENIREYRRELIINQQDLQIKLNEYLPPSKHHIVPTFMHIFDKIINTYQDDILKSFPKLKDVFYQFNNLEFISCQIGFKPFSLLSESGARINYKNFKKTNYIKDPELKYIKKMPTNKICLLSITEKIDDIFNSIFQKINELLGEKTLLKLFMRRTLFGCEFGICLNLTMKNTEIEDSNCIIDQDPLLLFTISVKSIVPILAGILIILLVYAASMSEKIVKWFADFPKTFTKEFLKKSVTLIVNIVAPELLNFALDKLIRFLKKTLKKQIKNLESHNESEKAQIASVIIKNLLNIFESQIGENINKKIAQTLSDKIKVTMKWTKFVKGCFDPVRIMKVSLLLLLCLATFIMNFNLRKDAIQKSQHDSLEYEKASFKRINENSKEIEIRDEENVNAAIENLQKENEIEANEEIGSDNLIDNEEDFNKLSKEEKKRLLEQQEQIEDKNRKEMISQFELINNTFLYKFKIYNTFDNIVKLSYFIHDSKNLLKELSNGLAEIKYYVTKGIKKNKVTRLRYYGFRKAFIQQVRIYATNKFPSILPMIGYCIHNKKFDLFVENKGKGTLENIVFKEKINNTQKLIIAYGIATALELLHSHNIVHRNVKPSNIMIDSKLKPFLYDFFYSKQIEIDSNYYLSESTPEFMAPEFINDYKPIQNSFKIDVFAFGITLFILLEQKNPFDKLAESQIQSNTINNVRPKFSKKVPNCWRELITKCWDQNPNERPTFKEICNFLENDILIDFPIDKKTFDKYKKKIKRPNSDLKAIK